MSSRQPRGGLPGRARDYRGVRTPAHQTANAVKASQLKPSCGYSCRGGLVCVVLGTVEFCHWQHFTTGAATGLPTVRQRHCKTRNTHRRGPPGDRPGADRSAACRVFYTPRVADKASRYGFECSSGHITHRPHDGRQEKESSDEPAVSRGPGRFLVRQRSARRRPRPAVHDGADHQPPISPIDRLCG